MTSGSRRNRINNNTRTTTIIITVSERIIIIIIFYYDDVSYVFVGLNDVIAGFFAVYIFYYHLLLVPVSLLVFHS